MTNRTHNYFSQRPTPLTGAEERLLFSDTRELAAWMFVGAFAAVPVVLFTFFALVWMALFL